ncbi:MAG: hypothetical protein VZR95_06175 [Alphaproteobacteria bacterium]
MWLTKVINRFIQRLDAPYSHKVIEYTVYQTDLAHPEDNPNYALIAPYIHLYPRLFKYIGGYGHMARVYSQAVLKHFNNRLPFEIERAIIEDSHPNLVWNITDAGHIWSKEAAEVMRKNYKLAYDNLIVKERKVRT